MIPICNNTIGFQKTVSLKVSKIFATETSPSFQKGRVWMDEFLHRKTHLEWHISNDYYFFNEEYFVSLFEIIISMKEIIFFVEEAPEGGYTAKALGEDIFTDADSLDELRALIKDAVSCHFDDEKMPQIVRLHFVKEETFSLAS